LEYLGASQALDLLCVYDIAHDNFLIEIKPDGVVFVPMELQYHSPTTFGCLLLEDHRDQNYVGYQRFQTIESTIVRKIRVKYEGSCVLEMYAPSTEMQHKFGACVMSLNLSARRVLTDFFSFYVFAIKLALGNTLNVLLFDIWAAMRFVEDALCDPCDVHKMWDRYGAAATSKRNSFNYLNKEKSHVGLQRRRLVRESTPLPPSLVCLVDLYMRRSPLEIAVSFRRAHDDLRQLKPNFYGYMRLLWHRGRVICGLSHVIFAMVDGSWKPRLNVGSAVMLDVGIKPIAFASDFRAVMESS
jgi:hypothetical protein